MTTKAAPDSQQAASRALLQATTTYGMLADQLTGATATIFIWAGGHGLDYAGTPMVAAGLLAPLLWSNVSAVASGAPSTLLYVAPAGAQCQSDKLGFVAPKLGIGCTQQPKRTAAPLPEPLLPRPSLQSTYRRCRRRRQNWRRRCSPVC